MKKLLSMLLAVSIFLTLTAGISNTDAASEEDFVYSEAVLNYIEANTETLSPEIGAYWTPQGSSVKTADGSAYDDEKYTAAFQKYVDAGLTFAVTGNEAYSMVQLDATVRDAARAGLKIWFNINLYKESVFNDVWYKYFIVAYLGLDYYEQAWKYVDITEEEWDELRSAEKRSYYDKIWDRYRDKINQDAIAAIYIVDEPDMNTAAASELYKEFSQLEAKMKEYGITTPVGINFFPITANANYNGNSIYNKYLDAYLLNADEVFSGYTASQNTKINVDWLMYDFYASQGSPSVLYINPYFVNQFYFMNYSQKLELPIYNFVNVVKQNGGGLYSPSRNQLLEDVNLRLMLGTEGICYFLGWPAYNNENGEWSNAMFNTDGSTTSSYDNVKYVNEKISGMKGIYLTFKNKDGVIEVNGSDVSSSLSLGSSASTYNGAGKGDVAKYNKKSTAALASASGSHAYIGLFTKENSTDEGFYVVNANYNSGSSENKLNFTSAKYYQIWGSDGLEAAGKASAITVVNSPADAKFVIVSDKEDARAAAYNNAVSIYEEASAKYAALDKSAYTAKSLEAYKALIDQLKAEIDKMSAPEVLSLAAQAVNDYALVLHNPNKNAGDMNGDGDIDGVDAGILLQMIAGWTLDSSVIKENADVNGDNDINGLDAGMLLQHIAKWDVGL